MNTDASDTKSPSVTTAAQSLYGRIVHAITITIALICMAGPVLVLYRPGENFLRPGIVFSLLWEGHDVKSIWEGAGAGFPGPHFYLQSLISGDGLIQFAIVLGCSAALIGLVPTMVCYFRGKDYLYAGLCLVICLLIGLSMTDIIL